MDVEEFNILYSKLLDKILSENKKAIIMGDFNIDLLKAKNKQPVEEFLQINLEHCYTPHITRPTRVTPHSKTLIDNIFTNFLDARPQAFLWIGFIIAFLRH